MQNKYERLGHRWFSQDVTRDSMIQFFQNEHQFEVFSQNKRRRVDNNN